MSTSTEDKAEIWKNVSKGSAIIRVFDRRGRTTEKTVRPGQDLSVTPLERQMNQDRILDKKNDPFSNGQFQPTHLVVDAEDYASIAANPNHIEESEMIELFKLPVADFRERLGEITNQIAMARIVEMADDDDTNARLPLVKAAHKRLDELTEKWSGMEESEDGDGNAFFGGYKIRPVSPN